MPETRRVDVDAIVRVLMPHEEHAGVFEEAVGFRTSTATSYKGVHLMNDLAQSVLGGAPAHGGDFLARVMRADVEGEGNAEHELRAHKVFGAAFSAAFPLALGADRVTSIRAAARDVLGFDGGVYAPGTSMCSPLATHLDLLGFEGFRRFGVGRFLADVLPEAGRARLRAAFESDRDPVTRAFRPLLLPATLENRQARTRRVVERSAFDRAFGDALTALMAQPLSKPALLRAVALGASLCLVLKVLGAGRDGGRPVALALAPAEDGGRKVLREEAVACVRKAVERLDARAAALIPKHPTAADLLKKPGPKAPAIEVPDEADPTAFYETIVAASRKVEGVYHPEDFAIAFGRKAGCVLPQSDRAGWGRHLALTPEFVEILVLMFVPHRAPPMPWPTFWREVREVFGVVIGANPTADARFLASAGIENVSEEGLVDNAEAILAAAVVRGIARRLPDGDAEVGGELV